MKTGKLIVIEGGDASGKATQTALLHDFLITSGVPVARIDFPQYVDNQVGTLLRECLDGKRGDFMSLDARIASTLYAADRREALPRLREWLQEEKVVLLDRYTSANMIHQGAKVSNEKERRELMQWIYRLEHEIMNLPQPDVVIYLDVPATLRAELAANRAGVLDVAERHTEHQERVDVAAKDMLSVYENSHSIACVTESGLLTKEEIAEKIQHIVRGIL